VFYFAATFASDGEKKRGVEERVGGGLEGLERGEVKVSKGWGLETDFPIPVGDGNGGEKAGNVFIVLIGWEGGSEACRTFTSTSLLEKKGDEEGEMLGLGKKEGCLASKSFYLTCDVMSRK
jgi:hypothetical protein